MPVFIFHKVPRTPPETSVDELALDRFELMLDYIANRFTVIPLRDIPHWHRRNSSECLAAITFDDGYPDWLDTAVPALLRRQLPAAFFITTGQFSGQALWHERIEAAVCRGAVHGAIELASPAVAGSYTLSSSSARHAASQRLQAALKYLSLSEREDVLRELENMAGLDSDSVPRMTREQVRDLSAKGFEIGAHTVNHPILTRCSTADATYEIGTCKEELEALTGVPVVGFAYPNGIPGVDFTAEHVSLIRHCGYSYGITTGPGAVRCDTSRFELPRFTPWSTGEGKAAYQMARNMLRPPKLVGDR